MSKLFFILPLFVVFSCAARPPRESMLSEKQLSVKARSKTVKINLLCDGPIDPSGSGVVVSIGKKDTKIATANHIAKYAKFNKCKIQVTSDIGERFMATVVKQDDEHDVAILKINDFIRNWAKIGTAFTGQSIICVGFPVSMNTSKYMPVHVLRTSVEAMGITSKNWIKIRDNIYYGFSGGPCFSKNLELIGIAIRLYNVGGTPFEFYITPSKYVKKLLQ